MKALRLLHRNTYLERWWECRHSAYASWYQPQVAPGRVGDEPRLAKDWEMVEDPYARPDFFRRGSATHEALKEVFMAALEDRDIDVFAIVRTVCQGLPNFQQAEVLELITRFQENLIDDPIRPDWVVSVEESYTVVVGDGRRFVFTPDVVELNSQRGHPQAGLIVTDWKSNWQVQPQAEFERDPQLKRYAAGLLEEFPRVNKVLLRKRFVRYGGAVRELSMTRDELAVVREELWNRMAMVDDAVHDLHFTGNESAVKATGGEWCGACTQRPTCPVVAYWDARSPESLDIVPDSLQDASRVLSGQMALQAKGKMLQEAVKRFAAQDDVEYLEHGTGYYGWKGKIKRIPPDLGQVQAVVEAIKEDFSPLRKLFKLDLTAFGKEKNNLPVPVVTAIDKIIGHKHLTEWRFTKGEPPEKGPPPPPEDTIDLMAALQKSLEDTPPGSGATGAPEGADTSEASEPQPPDPPEGSDEAVGRTIETMEAALVHHQEELPAGLACEHDDCMAPAIAVDENGSGRCAEHNATSPSTAEDYFERLMAGTLPPEEVTVGDPGWDEGDEGPVLGDAGHPLDAPSEGAAERGGGDGGGDLRAEAPDDQRPDPADGEDLPVDAPGGVPGAEEGGGVEGGRVPHWEQVHTCPCGKEFKGNTYFKHAKRCWHNAEHFDPAALD